MFGRTSTILSPIVAEMGEPMPMVSCIIICTASMFLSLRLEQPSSLKKEKEEKIEKPTELK